MIVFVHGVPETAAIWNKVRGAISQESGRSATPNPHHHWGPWTPTSAPGVVLHPSEDPFGDEALASEVAAALGARFEPIDGAGHFWPYQSPDAAAAILESFWASLS